MIPIKLSKTRTAAAPGVVFLNAQAFLTPEGRVASRAMDRCEVMLVLLGGWYQARAGGRRITAGEGDVVFYPRGTVRRDVNDPADPMNVFILHFHWLGAPRRLPTLLHDQQGRVRALAALLPLGGQPPSVEAAAFHHACMAAIVAEYLRLASRGASSLEARVRRYVEAAPGKRITAAVLARHFGYTPGYFSRLYKTATRRTPMRDVQRFRTELARVAIAGGGQTLRHIAKVVGLANEAHLCRLLRKFLGVTAREIRKRAGA